MKNILFVTPYFAPAWGYGGPPRINLDLAKELVTLGYHITVLTTDAFDGEKRCEKLSETIDGISVIRFKNISNRLAWNFKLFFPLGFAGYIKNNITKYDFVYMSDYRDWQNVFTYKACVKNKVPYGIAAYGELQISGGIKATIKRLYDKFWGLEMIKKATWLYAQTEHESKEYLNFGGKKNQCLLLPLGIDYKEFSGSKENHFREKYKIPKNDKLILFIGRINYLKGIDYLVKSMPEVVKEIPNSRLIIIGRDDGYYLNPLKELVEKSGAKDQINILGPIYGKDNHEAYLSADVFAFTPRHYEETSLACLGSLALGKPILTVHQSSIPYLEKYNAGYEINLDQKEITKRLISLLKDDNLIKSMGKNGKKLIADIFDLPKVGKVLENSIKQALEKKSDG